MPVTIENKEIAVLGPLECFRAKEHGGQRTGK